MICCFLKFIFWVVAYLVIALNYWPATGHVSIKVYFYTNWVISPASLVESCSLFLSLMQRKTALWSVVCETESKLAFVASVCERNYKENKEKRKHIKWWIFVYMVCCCDLPLQPSWSQFVKKVRTRAKKRNKGEGVLPLFFLSFILLSLSLSLSPTFAPKLDRKLLRGRLSRN